MAALSAAPAFAVARRTTVVTRATSDGAPTNKTAAAAASPGLNRRNIILSVPAFLAGASAAGSASAKAPPTYYDDTIEVIGLTRSIISGSDLTPANIAKFQAKPLALIRNPTLYIST